MAKKPLTTTDLDVTADESVDPTSPMPAETVAAEIPADTAQSTPVAGVDTTEATNTPVVGVTPIMTLEQAYAMVEADKNAQAVAAEQAKQDAMTKSQKQWLIDVETVRSFGPFYNSGYVSMKTGLDIHYVERAQKYILQTRMANKQAEEFAFPGI